MALNFQDLILTLHKFWAEHGCLIWQPYNQQVGAGTMNPATYLRSLGPEPWNVAYIEPSVRPDDGRFGENPNRLYTHTQYQVILKPTPENSQELYLESLAAIGIDRAKHDIRFVEDNWAQPAIGAWGLGWEVWLDGLEITQYTYFQQVGGVTLDPVPLEITYGLERIAMALQGVKRVFDLKWDNFRSYGDVKFQDEVERSKYAFEYADVEMLHEQFDATERECRRVIGAGLVMPAHDMVLQMSNTFNLLDTRGAIGVTERQRFLGRTRDLAKEVANAYVKQREDLGHPWLKATPHRTIWPQSEPAAAAMPAASAQPETLLLEIGVEELPAHCVSEGHDQLAKLAPELLKEARLSHGEVRVLATPRRLTLIVQNVAPAQAAIEENVKGPGAKIAIDKDGNPTQAGIAFAKRFGLEAKDLQVIEEGKNSYVYARRFEAGKPAVDVLPELCRTLVSKLTFEKTMRWNSSNVAFSRPLQWYVALLGGTALPFMYANIVSGNISRGARGLGSPRFAVVHANDYEPALAAQHVIADVATRKIEIARQIAIAAAVGGVIEPNDELLEEVANLVEQPAALLCDFDKAYLDMPALILTKVMSSKQRYFTVNDAKTGAMLPHFVTVRNGPAEQPAEVIAGNAEVVFARFADASYFFKRDIKKPLGELVPALHKLTFQTKLGSMLDKTKRLESLVEAMASQLGASGDDTAIAIKAAGLAKADLASGMVVEMTSLQGAMGREYLMRQGGDAQVADAILEHYLPRFAGDRVPASTPGLAVALADKLDSIAGLFAVGLAPKGSADPFALRRAAIGVVSALVANQRGFSVSAGLRSAAARLPVPMSPEALDAAARFISDRQRAALLEDGKRNDAVEAVLAVQADNPYAAAQQVLQLETAVAAADWPILLAAFSRCARISKAFVDDGRTPVSDPEPASQALKTALDGLEKPADVSRFISALRGLEPAITYFFDKVLVNAEDAGHKHARLQLVSRVAALAAGVCDVSKLEGF